MLATCLNGFGFRVFIILDWLLSKPEETIYCTVSTTIGGRNREFRHFKRDKYVTEYNELDSPIIFLETVIIATSGNSLSYIKFTELFKFFNNLFSLSIYYFRFT